MPDATLSGGGSAYAPSPFDHPKADIILRSSDNVDFRVFRLFLSLGSPFFESLFDIPQPSQAPEDQVTKDGLVVIHMEEDSNTLHSLLCFCYPCTLVEDPQLEAFQDVLAVLEASQKYLLDGIEQNICRALSNPRILIAEPLRCFAVARRAQLHEETLLAAKYTLARPLIPAWFEEIDLITAADLLALLTYHRKCGDAVYALRTDLSWIKSHYRSTQGCAWLLGEYLDGNIYNDIHYSDCRCPRSSTTKYCLFESTSLQWWDDFMEETFEALRDKPCRATVECFAQKTIQNVLGRNCPTCSANISEGMRGLIELITNKLDEVVSQIQLDFDKMM